MSLREITLLPLPSNCQFLGRYNGSLCRWANWVMGDFMSWDGDLDRCVGALGGLIG